MRRVPLALLVLFVGASVATNMGCASIWGFDNLTLGPSDGGQGDEALRDGGGATEGGGCMADDAVACQHKCGQLFDSCQKVVDCGGCDVHLACGGMGTPNMCGPGTCTPSCAGKACGASDGCSGVCAQGDCGQGQRCVAGVCQCDGTLCGGCCNGSTCELGNGDSACGSGGKQCASCSPGQTCTAGGCTGGGGGTLVLFGGCGANDGCHSSLGDTWTFNGSNWSQVTVANPPPARASAPMATLGNEVVLFGGEGGPNNVSTLQDTWTFNGSSWSQVSTPAPSVSSFMASMATLGNELVACDGSSDVWAFNGTLWADLAAGISPSREYTVIAMLGSKVVLFGGSNAGTSLNDTWTFDGASWSQVPVANAPPARWDANMATLGSQVVLFGGIGSSGLLNDTWMFNGSSWTQVTVANPPPARELPSMATLGNQVILFGGCSYSNASGCTLLNDTWTFSGTSWTQVMVSNPPPVRDSASMALLR